MPDHEGEAETVVPGEVLELLEERARVQEWLDGLTGLREESTPAVYEKVRADYEERLEGVSGRLSEHRGELERSVARRRSRVEELEKELDGARMRLEEAELRHRVGEFGEEEWDRLRRQGEARTEELEARLEEEASGLGELERVLGELVAGRRSPPEEAGAGPSAPEPPAADASPPEPRAPASALAETGSEPREPDASGGRTAAAAAPPEGMERGAGEPGPGEAGEGEASRDAEAEEAEEAVDDAAAEYLDELEFLESLSLDDPEPFDAVSAMLEEEDEEPREEGRSS